MSSPLVFVAMPTRTGTPEVHESFWSALVASNVGPGSNEVHIGKDAFNVACARNKLVQEFLRAAYDNQRYTHLLMVDDDVVVPADCIEQLLACDSDIATGCYPICKTNNSRTQFYLAVREKDWHETWFDDIRDITQCGCGVMLIRREVLEHFAPDVFHWPSDGMVEVNWFGEDNDFCDRSRADGFTIRANGKVRCSHFKRVDMSSVIDEDWRGPLTVQEQSMHTSEWGSHVPVLQAIGQTFTVKTVVEYGLGKYSTPAFLSRDIFPHLERLISIEHNSDWIELVSAKLEDPRWESVFCHMDAMRTRAGMLGIPDLVFIDCGDPQNHEQDYPRRAELIEHYEPTGAIVVVHDSDHMILAGACAMATYNHKFYFEPKWGPHTAVLSNNYDVAKLKG